MVEKKNIFGSFNTYVKKTKKKHFFHPGYQEDINTLNNRENLVGTKTGKKLVVNSNESDIKKGEDTYYLIDLHFDLPTNV